MLMKLIFSHSELSWQQNVSRLSIQYKIEQDEKGKMLEKLDQIAFIRKKKMQEAAEQNEAERRAAGAKKSWSEWLGSYWINMDYNTTTSDDSTNAGSAFDEFAKAGTLVPTPSASGRVSTRPGRVSTAPDRTSTTTGSDFKKSRVSQRERMSTNYIW